VAEGIELRRQLTHLQAVGCHAGQGFYFSRPLPTEALERLLPKRSGAPGVPPSSLVQQTRQRADELVAPAQRASGGAGFRADRHRYEEHE
jgi:predicted signal transduction protein with EAL and GGDEF domain